MRESEAMEWVRRLHSSAQKCRSNLIETLETMDTSKAAAEAVCESLYPWLFGPKSILRATAMILERGTIETGQFFNLMYVANRPEMRVLLGVWLIVSDLPEFPEQDTRWIAEGWEPETVGVVN